MRVRSLGAPIVVSAGAWALLACTSILGDYAIGSAGDAGAEDGALGDAAVDGATLPDATGPCPGAQLRCNGTCRETSNDVNNCGPSCKVCTAGPHATAGCVSGACTAPCNAGFTACGSPATCVDLTRDPLNCRACGRSCQGGSCSASVCQPALLVAAASAGQVNDIASDGTVVVWADGSGSVNQVSTPGGARIVLSTAVNPRAVAINGTRVNWLEFDGASTSKLSRATAGSAASGTPLTTLVNATNGLAINAAGTQLFTTHVSAVPKLELLGCTDTGTCNQLTTTAGTQPGYSMTLDPTNTYAVFSDVTNSTIVMYKISGGTSTSVTGQPGAFWLASDMNNAYWANGSVSPTPIMSAAFGSTTATPILADAGGSVDGIATDGTNVYFVAGGEIRYVPVAGAGAPITFPSVSGAGHLKYAARALYYDDAGGIYRVVTP